MYVYLISTFTLFSVLLGFINSRFLKNIIYHASCLGLIALFAMQDVSVGADTAVYCNAYDYIQNWDFEDALGFGWEPLYMLLNWIVGIFFEDSRSFLLVLAFVILVPIFSWIKRESSMPELSLVIFVGSGMWWASMGIFRQWCAMALLTYSYKYIKNRKFFPFLGMVLLAALFHRTAAIFILAYFLPMIPLKLFTMGASILASGAIGILGNYIVHFLSAFARNETAYELNGGISMLVVLWGCVLIIFAFYKGNIPDNIKLYYQLLWFAAVLQPIAFVFSNWARVVIYFSISLVVLLPELINQITTGRNYCFRVPFILILSIFMIIWNILQKSNPYQFMVF